LEQAPVSIGEPLKEFADFEVVASHGADLGHQFLADVFGEGLLVHLGGEVVAALGGVFVEGALEEVQGVVNLAFELFLTEAEDLTLLVIHKRLSLNSMRIYTHTLRH
jgi:hypothetical protein